MTRPFEQRRPRIAASAFVADSATLIGDVVLGEQASIWFGAVVRADINGIEIGDRSNVQDLCVLHVTAEHPVRIAEDVTLGHRATVHGATVGARCLIGIGATVLDGAVIGEESLIAAGALVTPGTLVPPRSLVAGLPGRVLRALSAEEVERHGRPARNYVDYTARYKKEQWR